MLHLAGQVTIWAFASFVILIGLVIFCICVSASLVLLKTVWNTLRG